MRQETPTQPTKPGAYARMEDLEQAVDQQKIWTNARDRLLRECYALGWSVRELHRVTGLSRETIKDRIAHP
jgi:hypothetical protein